MIKKIVLSLLALVGLALVLAPMLIGRAVEQKVQEAFSNGQVPAGIHVLAYERGWFSSQVNIGIDVQHPKVVRILDLTSDFQGGTVVEIDQTLRHGPVVGAAGGWFAALAGEGAVTHAMSGLSLALRLQIAFNQKVSLHLTDQQTRLLLDQRSVLTLQEWQVTVTAGGDDGPVIMFNLDDLVLTQGSTEGRVAGVSGRVSNLAMEGGLPTGVGQLQAQRISWPGFEANALDVASRLVALDGISTGRTTVTLQRIDSALIGAATDGMAVIDFANINHRVVGPLLSSAGKPEQADVHRQYWQRLLATSPRLNEFSIALESTSGPASIVVVADGEPASGWMEGVAFELDARVPPALLEQLAVLKALAELPPEHANEAVTEANMWLQHLRANGIVVLQGSDYITRLSYSNQVADLNGMVMQLPNDW